MAPATPATVAPERLDARRHAVLGAVVAAAALLCARSAAASELTLLDGPLRLDLSPAPRLAPIAERILLAAADAPAPGAAEGEAQPAGEANQAEPAKDGEPPEEGEPPSLDFDLLGEAKPPPESGDAASLRRRRTMLQVHQGIGLGLVALQLGTTVVGQLNYSDRYAGGPETNQYRTAHKALAYTTAAVFATAGLIALFAPSPGTPKKMDRVMVHRVSMVVATAGMITQVALGIYTRERVGYEDQEKLATAHLAVGYVTLAAMLVGVGALVF